MDGVSIHDRIGLNDLLRALGSRAEHAWWRPKTVITYVSEDGQSIDALETDGVGGPWTAGQALLRLHGELGQVIDGVLESVSGEPPELGIVSQPWVILRAVDSSWWEVYTDDGDVQSELRRQFRDIRPALYSPEYPATDYGV